jgi:uncharacterized protein YjbI with pentapeptide repeats
MDRNECLIIVTEARKKGERADLIGADLSRANLIGADLSRADLSRANLIGADLSRADLIGANLIGADLSRANLIGANLIGANLSRANLIGANLSRANLSGANLSGANLVWTNLSGANLIGADKIASMAVFTGLYEYQCWAVVTDAGVPWVRMGCLLKSLADWDTIGIRKSNLGEFKDDGSVKSERRIRAFDFTRAEAVRLAAEFKESEAK